MAASGSAVPKHLRGQPGACLGILDDAIRFNVNPYALARESYFVNDILAYQARVFMAIVNAHAPLKTRPDIKWEGDGQNRRCIVTGIFRDGAVREYKSPRFADIQPKNSPLWKTDPDQQLSYYSLRAFARRWCPEVVMGIYDTEEIRDAAMTDITPTQPIPQSLDDWTTDSSSTGDSDPSPPSPEEPDDTAGAVAPTTAPADLRQEAIDKILVMVTDKSTNQQQKLENLTNLQPVYEDMLPADFAKTLLATAAKVAKGEQMPDKARGYLENLP
jgi:hypothetical protein